MENIKTIKNIRSKNNVLWMRLLEIALESNPKETRKVLKQILKNDKKISNQLSKMLRV